MKEAKSVRAEIEQRLWAFYCKRHLRQFQDEEYYSAVAKTVDDVRKPGEDGWTYFCETDDAQIFGKSK